MTGLIFCRKFTTVAKTMDDLEEEVIACICFFLLLLKYQANVLKAISETLHVVANCVTVRERRTLWLNWFSQIHDMSHVGFHDTFRMNQVLFDELLRMCMATGKMPAACYATTGLRNNRLDAGNALGMTIFFLAQGTTLRAVEKQFGFSFSRCHSVISSTLVAICQALADSIKIPEGNDACQESALWCEGERFAEFAGCLMAVDGTHIPFR